MNRVTVLAAMCLAAACAVPLQGMDRPGVIAGEYVAMLHSNTTEQIHKTLANRLPGARTATIGKFRAVFAALGSADLAWLLQQDHAVQLVEPNMVRRAAQASCPNTQGEPVSWGQVRTTVRAASDVTQVYAHDAQWGSGVDVYIADTGILCSHEDFAGRCTWGTNTIGGSGTDVSGHGTHCASTVGGARYGIAKSANLIAVKVLDDNGGGTVQSCILGYEWSAAQALLHRRPSVVSASLGGGFSAVENAAVNAVVAQGLSFSVAAGNSNGNACNESPGSAEACVCVGSTELSNQGGQQVDRKSSFSNHGSCVDIHAPGSAITAAYVPNSNSYATLSGTSMACPHVTGVIAAIYSRNTTATPDHVKQTLYSTATEGVIQNLPANTVNRMLHLEC